MLMQGARYLLKVLFVKLEERQALEDGRDLNFSGFGLFFFPVKLKLLMVHLTRF